MNSCYASDAVFWDPVFHHLNYSDTLHMWTMLCKQSKNLAITYQIIADEGDQVKVAWVAKYSFSKTNRTVTNRVTATMKIRDGKIVQHTDQFDFWAWSRQALGLVGTLLGWTKALNLQVHQQALSSLERFKR